MIHTRYLYSSLIFFLAITLFSCVTSSESQHNIQTKQSGEIMPEPIGGIGAITEKITYPEDAKEKKIEGKVYVLAFVDEMGDVTGVMLLKGIGSGCDEEALNAVKNTKFSPGLIDGKPVKTQVSIPIIFKLE